MKRWWLRRTLKLRLALWYAAATAAVLVAFAIFFYELIEHRLSAEIERQLRIDFDLIEAQLEPDAQGQIRWPLRGSHGDEGYARLSAWFEVWAENGELLLRHWPVPDAKIHSSLPAPSTTTLKFSTVELEPGLHVRLMERPARIRERGVMLRIFRDETEMRRTLRETLEVFMIGLPLAILLASVGGYLVAGQSLAPIAAMAAQAHRITSESLSQRLAVTNPHDELGRLAEVFNDTLARLQASFDELKRFTADASHELRSPLTALRTVGEVGLREARGEDDLRETIGSMLEEGQRLGDLIDALLTLARMESGKVELQREPVGAAEILNDVQSHLDILACEKHQRLNVSADSELRVLADRALLRQALVNILHNAIRYSPEDTRIDLRAMRRDNEVVLEIADQGLGIAPEHRTKIFERFYRADKARSKNDGGAGLGLAIAKWSVESQQGRIEVEGEPGRGSVFRVIVPAS
jgi:two-component system OmpR family sensor kinase